MNASALTIDETLKLASQIIDALDAAHERGIVHRDLKPANVKATPEGVVKVLDFGIAKVLQPSNAGSPDATMHRTEIGTVLGTLASAAPAQGRDERAASTPVFSPDGQWLAFVENGVLDFADLKPRSRSC